jgi:prepilin signal peptidase PulO-like enzyme (type II secretory pathway)
MDLLLFAGLGAITASFTGVLVERLYTGQSWVRARSRCDACGIQLTARDLVPIFSYLSHRGACRHCKARIPVASFLYEVLLAGLFVLAYLTFFDGLALLLFLAALSVLGFITLYDLRHTVVPFPASTALILLSLAFSFVSVPSIALFGETLLIALAITAGFLILHFASKGRAMGFGDAPVAFALSVLAAPYAFPGLLFSFWIGAAVGILVLVMRRGGPTMGIEVPFVPFLAVGYILAYFLQWNPLALLI